ncbi:hypothetical protein ACWD3J_26560 [Streptomyces sp. NPDC002755]|uniref:hypothetical protein n=1 Tax=Streptomyces sp. NPDC002884 TaxID=3154544 RepID=UPI00331D6C07
MLHWISEADWGTVPAWMSAGSLLLAFRIFLKDRWNSEREQVDAVGVWATIESTERVNEDSEMWSAIISLTIKNNSKLPVDVLDLSCGIIGRSIRKSSNSESAASFDESPPMLNINDKYHSKGTKVRFGSHRIPPEESWVPPYGYEISYLHPKGLDKEESWELEVVPLVLTVVDNAGRMWKLHPASGFRARRVRWLERREISRKRKWKRYGSDGLQMKNADQDSGFFVVVQSIKRD